MIDHVTIAGLRYDVQFLGLEEGDMGLIYTKRAMIQIDSGMPLHMEIRSLLHEVAHGMLYQFTDSSEPQAATLARLLEEMIVDNPRLLNYVLRPHGKHITDIPPVRSPKENALFEE